MDYTLTDIKPSRKQVIITRLDESLLQKAQRKALAEFGRNLHLKGFRPGKIPEKVIRDFVDPKHVQARTLEMAIPEALSGIALEKKLKIIGQPELKMESLEPLKLSLTFDISPEIMLGDYHTIQITLEKKTATDEEVEEAVKYVHSKMTTFEDAPREVKEGDRVEIDFQGFHADGTPYPELASKQYPLILGSGLFIPGFEEQLKGMKKSEEKSFVVTFPRDYHEHSLTGKEVKFQVKVLRLEQPVVPEINEAFVEKVTGKKQSVEEWKKAVKEQIQKEHDRMFARQREELTLQKLLELIQAEIPKTLIDHEKKMILEEIKQQIQARGMSYERYLESTKKNEEQLLESFEKQAEDRVKLRLALFKIAEQEGVTLKKALEKILPRV